MDKDQAGFAIEKLGTLDASRRPTRRPIGPEEDPAGFANEAGHNGCFPTETLAGCSVAGISATRLENGLRPERCISWVGCPVAGISATRPRERRRRRETDRTNVRTSSSTKQQAIYCEPPTPLHYCHQFFFVLLPSRYGGNAVQFFTSTITSLGPCPCPCPCPCPFGKLAAPATAMTRAVSVAIRS